MQTFVSFLIFVQRTHRVGQVLYGRLLTGMQAHFEVSYFLPPPPAVDGLSAHGLLKLHEEEVTELGTDHRVSPYVAILRDQFLHLSSLSAIGNMDAVPDVCTIIDAPGGLRHAERRGVD